MQSASSTQQLDLCTLARLTSALSHQPLPSLPSARKRQWDLQIHLPPTPVRTSALQEIPPLPRNEYGLEDLSELYAAYRRVGKGQLAVEPPVPTDAKTLTVLGVQLKYAPRHGAPESASEWSEESDSVHEEDDLEPEMLRRESVQSYRERANFSDVAFRAQDRVSMLPGIGLRDSVSTARDADETLHLTHEHTQDLETHAAPPGVDSEVDEQIALDANAHPAELRKSVSHVGQEACQVFEDVEMGPTSPASAWKSKEPRKSILKPPRDSELPQPEQPQSVTTTPRRAHLQVPIDRVSMEPRDSAHRRTHHDRRATIQIDRARTVAVSASKRRQSAPRQTLLDCCTEEGDETVIEKGDENVIGEGDENVIREGDENVIREGDEKLIEGLDVHPQQQLVYAYASTASPASRRVSSVPTPRNVSSRRLSVEVGTQSELTSERLVPDVSEVDVAKRRSNSGAPEVNTPIPEQGQMIGFVGVLERNGVLTAKVDGRTFELVVQEFAAFGNDGKGVQCSAADIDSDMDVLFAPMEEEPEFDPLQKKEIAIQWTSEYDEDETVAPLWSLNQDLPRPNECDQHLPDTGEANEAAHDEAMETSQVDNEIPETEVAQAPLTPAATSSRKACRGSSTGVIRTSVSKGSEPHSAADAEASLGGEQVEQAQLSSSQTASTAGRSKSRTMSPPRSRASRRGTGHSTRSRTEAGTEVLSGIKKTTSATNGHRNRNSVLIEVETPGSKPSTKEPQHCPTWTEVEVVELPSEDKVGNESIKFATPSKSAGGNGSIKFVTPLKSARKCESVKLARSSKSVETNESDLFGTLRKTTEDGTAERSSPAADVPIFDDGDGGLDDDFSIGGEDVDADQSTGPLDDHFGTALDGHAPNVDKRDDMTESEIVPNASVDLDVADIGLISPAPLLRSTVKISGGLNIEPEQEEGYASTEKEKTPKVGGGRKKKPAKKTSKPKQRRTTTNKQSGVKRKASSGNDLKRLGLTTLRAPPVEIEDESVGLDDIRPRRSKRRRFPPLQYWKNEKKVYNRRMSQIMPTIAEVVVAVDKRGGDESELSWASVRARNIIGSRR